MNIDKFVSLAKSDINAALVHDFETDDGVLVYSIYENLFPFVNTFECSDDVVFTWKSASLVRDVDYLGRRDSKVYNNHYIGNLFPNFKTDRKYSLNLNRNGMMGDFPHDYIDIYLMHVAKYAYKSTDEFVLNNIKEYYPLKRAILDERNMKFFQYFDSFEFYLSCNYFTEVWKEIAKKPFSDMEFRDYVDKSLYLIEIRGNEMINSLLKNSQ